MSQRLNPCPTAAFTLTEMAITIGILGLLLGAVWLGAGSVNSNYRVSHTSEQLVQIVQGVRMLHLNQRNLDASINAIKLAKAGVIPRDMLDKPEAPTIVTSIWGGNVAIVAEDSKVFSVTFEGIPNEACTSLIVRTAAGNRDRGLEEIGTGVQAFSSMRMPVSIEKAAAACAAGTNSVVFYYSLREKMPTGGGGGSKEYK